MQTCPNCHSTWQDDANYCSQCRTKLPNADERLPDYNRLHGTTSLSPEKKLQLLGDCLGVDKFRNRLLGKILLDAIEWMKSSSPQYKHVGEDILVIAVTEAIKYTEEKNIEMKDGK